MAEQPVRILLIDDNEEYHAIARHYLRSFHNRSFELHWVPSEESALQELSRQANYDIILMDYFLQGTNGIELTKKLHGNKVDIPIILLSGNKDFRIAIEAMKFGVEEYLVKEEAVDTILPRTVLGVIERFQLKKKLREAETETLMAQKKTEAIQELLVTMCHEFNNPLAAIKISTDILARRSVTEPAKQLLGRLNQDISRLEKEIIKLRDSNGEP